MPIHFLSDHIIGLWPCVSAFLFHPSNCDAFCLRICTRNRHISPTRSIFGKKATLYGKKKQFQPPQRIFSILHFFFTYLHITLPHKNPYNVDPFSHNDYGSVCMQTCVYSVVFACGYAVNHLINILIIGIGLSVACTQIIRAMFYFIFFLSFSSHVSCAPFFSCILIASAKHFLCTNNQPYTLLHRIFDYDRYIDW